MNTEGLLTALVAFVILVGLVYLVSVVSGSSMDDLVGWAALGAALGVGVRR